jgi:hypothetical protein
VDGEGVMGKQFGLEVSAIDLTRTAHALSSNRFMTTFGAAVGGRAKIVLAVGAEAHLSAVSGFSAPQEPNRQAEEWEDCQCCD